MGIRSKLGISSVLFKFLFFSGKLVTNNTLFIKLLQVIRPLIKSGLVIKGTIFISRALSTQDKIRIATHHYSFLQRVFSPKQLKLLFSDGIECYSEFSDNNLLRVSLWHCRDYDYEGLCSLIYKVNGIEYARLSFMVAPGVMFGLKQDNIFYISCMQKKHTAGDGNNKATHIANIHPITILLQVFTALGAANNITTCIAVAAKNQLSFIENDEEYDYFFSIYDNFWLSKGGSKFNTEYLLPLPLLQKPILDVKQTHRNRIRKKRVKLQEIYHQVYNVFYQMQN